MDRGTFLRLALLSGATVALPGSARLSRSVTALPPPASHPSAPHPSTPGPPVAVRELDDRIVLSNGIGDWSIWKQVTWSADGQRLVGPGYVGRLEQPGGRRLVDDFRMPGTINDPRYGGLGAFGWQHARAGRGAWDIHGRLDAARNGGFGISRATVVSPPALSADGTGSVALRVEFRDGWQDPVLATTYRYLVEPRVVICVVEAEQLWQEDGQGQAFLKEPKLVAAVKPVYPLVDVYRIGEELLRRIELRNLSEPWFQTAQIGERSREGVAFVGVTTPSLNVTMQSWDGGQVLPWCGAGAGFDGWAEAAQGRPALSDLGAPYCLAGGTRLRRRWEVAARTEDPALSCLFHAWEGGQGLTDCLDASRAFGPAGETWSVIATYRA
jgi:hypothetical protein